MFRRREPRLADSFNRETSVEVELRQRRAHPSVFVVFVQAPQPPAHGNIEASQQPAAPPGILRQNDLDFGEDTDGAW